jgi:hypothetical protein
MEITELKEAVQSSTGKHKIGDENWMLSWVF